MTPEPYRVVIEKRISELLAVRCLYRRNRWADWPVARVESEVELRALVRLAREARKADGWSDHPVHATVESEYAR